MREACASRASVTWWNEADDFEQLDARRLEQHHVRRLKALGDSVVLTPLPSPERVPA